MTYYYFRENLYPRQYLNQGYNYYYPYMFYTPGYNTPSNNYVRITSNGEEIIPGNIWIEYKLKLYELQLRQNISQQNNSQQNNSQQNNSQQNNSQQNYNQFQNYRNSYLRRRNVSESAGQMENNEENNQSQSYEITDSGLEGEYGIRRQRNNNTETVSSEQNNQTENVTEQNTEQEIDNSNVNDFESFESTIRQRLNRYYYDRYLNNHNENPIVRNQNTENQNNENSNSNSRNIISGIELIYNLTDNNSSNVTINNIDSSSNFLNEINNILNNSLNRNFENEEEEQQNILSSEQINNRTTLILFNSEENTELENCCICRDSYCDGCEIRKINACGHCFHKNCLDTWLQHKNTCPLCRTNV